MKRRLVVLRPEPAATRTLQRALERGFNAVAAPLFLIEPVDWAAPDPRLFDGLLLTSANAVLHGGPGLESVRRLPVHAVGEATASAARAAGFAIQAVGSRGVDQLLQETAPGLRLLHLCGEQHRRPSRPGAEIVNIAVYRARPFAAPDLRALDGAIALVHSPAAARRLAELVEDRSSIGIAAISEAAAVAAGQGWSTVEHAAEPSDEALLALAARLCNIPGLE